MPKAKEKTAFYCQECGHESAKWLGQCPACKKWNTFVEERVRVSPRARTDSRTGASPGPVKLSEVSMEKELRCPTGIGEFDRVLGGGIVAGSLTLVGGDPGIGKSTLLLQMGMHLASDHKKVLYISGEESLRQIKLRANRLISCGAEQDSIVSDGAEPNRLISCGSELNRLTKTPEDFLLYCETDLETIEETVRAVSPDVLIIDSVQTMCLQELSSAPGSVSQIREATGVFLRIAKEHQISVFLIGHVTKEGTVAGPRVLEHMVDTVLYLEGDRFASYRLLRAVKNRFGRTNEIGVFEMRESGLTEVEDPSEFMLSGRPQNASGSVISCAVEGTRPIMLEIQALVTQTIFGFPKRQANGTDHNRVSLLMAVLEKRVGLRTGASDAYVNLAGGMRIEEPALDLGIVLAVASSYLNAAVKSSLMVFGEVGLSGEVRAVRSPLERVLEAKKLGFDTVMLPKVSLKAVQEVKGVEFIGVENVKAAIDAIKGK